MTEPRGPRDRRRAPLTAPRAPQARPGRQARQAPQALALAYAYLDRRERTEAEVRAHLVASGLQAGEVEAAMRELLQLGHLDDDRYARLFVEDKRALSQWGSERIRRTLRERGVERDVVERALAAGDDDGDQDGDGELSRALALLRRRFPAPPVEPRERERALGVMIRKGYDAELALDALAAYARQ